MGPVLAGADPWRDSAEPAEPEPAGDMPVAGPAGTSGEPERSSSAGRILRPEDYLAQTVEPPRQGWQRLAWHAGVRWVRPSRREMRHRVWVTRIRRRMSSPKIIAVMSPKGGVGKSTTAAQLGHVLAAVRGDPVAALDANPDFGNLVKRLSEPYSTYSADQLHRDADQLGCYNDLAPYVTVADSGLCVIRSCASGAARLGPAEYRRVLRVLSRFFSLVIVDLGTGMREPTSLAIMTEADALIAVTDATLDGAEVVIEGVDGLPARLGNDLLDVVVVINAVRVGSGSMPPERLAAAFEQYTKEPVLHVPHDRHLARGGIPRWSLLASDTQDAYLELAATIVNALPGCRARLPLAAGDGAEPSMP
jgi:MinD-like ATPase involved in chromosome partitioning or flagellar assembly